VGLITGDANPDLVVTVPSANQVRVYPGQGNGSFGAAISQTACSGGVPGRVAIGNFNGGALDWVVACQGVNQLGVFFGNGSGGAGAPMYIASCSNPVAIKIADVNGDGLQDIVTACHDSNMSNGSSFTISTYSTGNNGQPSDVTVGQLNGDSLLDIAVTNQNSSEVAVLFNQGSGTFGGLLGWAEPAGPTSVAVGDYNGDGRDDVVVGVPVGLSGPSGGHILRLGRRPAPVAAEGAYSFTLPANTISITFSRGGDDIGMDTLLTAPASPGAQSLTLPLTSTLAPARLAPSGQNVSWDLTATLRTASSGLSDGSSRLGSYVFRRQ
jgi:hypothetical protein